MLLSVQELRGAVSFLRQARELVESVKLLFRRQGADCASRLGEIMMRINDEREFIERLMAKAPNGGPNG